MTQTELIKKVAKEQGLSEAKAEKLVKAVLSAISEALKSGEEVRLSSLGVFKFGQRSERKGRNPRTGKEMVIPAKKVVRFVANKSIREAVNTAKAGK
jgi:DNA-binding protein HU-beta